MQDMLAGSADSMLTDSASAMAAVPGGQARLLAVLSAERVAVAADALTARELRPGDIVAHACLGMGLAAATPASIIARLNTVLNRAVASEEVAPVMRNIGAAPVPGDAADFTTQIAAGAARWRPLIRERGIRLD